MPGQSGSAEFSNYSTVAAVFAFGTAHVKYARKVKDPARIFIAIGSVVCGTGVMLGAFGAHGLKGKITEASMATYQSGVFYQLIHGLAMVAVGLCFSTLAGKKLVSTAGWLFLVGVVLFSFSLYLLAVADIVLALLPPMGGLAFMAGWGCLATAALSKRKD